MKTATAIAMFTLLGLTSVQLHASPATADKGLSGVPMSTAKRLLNAPASTVERTSERKSGLPMYRATRSLGPQHTTLAADAGVSTVPLSGVPMVHAKRPEPGTARQRIDLDVSKSESGT